MASTRPRLPCRFFATPRGCNRGDTCTFSHDRNVRQHETEQNQRAAHVPFNELQLWCFRVPKSADARNLGSDLPEFWKQAQALVEQGAKTRQAVVTRLATEGGLLRINEVRIAGPR